MGTESQCSTAADLTEDIIIQILMCLPLFSVFRFRCVCKSWYKLLDKKFIGMKLKNPFKLLVTRKRLVNHEHFVESKSLKADNEDAENIVYPFKNELYGCIQIVGSCNGLICACYAGHVFYVWNPCTGEYKVILSILTKNSIREIDRGYRCLESHSESMNYRRVQSFGFGYDSNTGGYKFVSILEPDRRDVSQVDIYTLRSNSWKSYSSHIPYEISRGEPGVFLNRSLHWVANSRTSQPRVLISMDMNDGVVNEIPQPQYTDDFNHKFVGVLRGSLCLLCSVSNAEFEIWEMKDYGMRAGWSKVFKIDCQELMGMGIPSCDYIRRAVYLLNGDILLGINRKGEAYELGEVDVVKVRLDETKRHQNIREYDVYMKNIIEMEAYLDTLVSVNSGKFVGNERKDHLELRLPG